MSRIGRTRASAFGILGVTFAFSAFVGWAITFHRERRLNKLPTDGFHMWLGDSVHFNDSGATTVADALSRLAKPAVVFAIRDSCSTCFTEFELIESVARKNDMRVWMLIITDRSESWEPPTSVLERLDMAPARVSREIAAGWGIRDTPAVIGLGLGSRLLIFRQGAGAAVEFKAAMWRPNDPTAAADEKAALPSAPILVPSKN